MSKQWPMKQEESKRVREEQRDALLTLKSHPDHVRVAASLKRTGLKWTRQAAWGYRLFDFWNSTSGIAVEIDSTAPESADLRLWERSGIVVFKISPNDHEKLSAVIDRIRSIKTSWFDRRRFLGITGKKHHLAQYSIEEYFGGPLIPCDATLKMPTK